MQRSSLRSCCTNSSPGRRSGSSCPRPRATRSRSGPRSAASVLCCTCSSGTVLCTSQCALSAFRLSPALRLTSLLVRIFRKRAKMLLVHTKQLTVASTGCSHQRSEHDPLHPRRGPGSGRYGGRMDHCRIVCGGKHPQQESPDVICQQFTLVLNSHRAYYSICEALSTVVVKTTR